jgi:hypothetical protein
MWRFPLSETKRTRAERQAAGSKGGHKSWGNTLDRTARTAKPRKAFEDKFLREAGGDPKRAESLRRAYFAELTLRSLRARRLAKEARAAGVDRDTA